MRLLKWSTQHELSLTADLADDEIPPYAILSHTWGDDDDELTLADIQQNRGRDKAGFKKIQFCGEQAKRDGIECFWVDTCCINKENHVELAEAITSMYRWYREAQKCYVYLSDVSTIKSRSDTQSAQESGFRSSRWFKRGWTLQELLAPKVVDFFSSQEQFIGTKATLAQQIHEITSIPLAALNGTPLSQFTIADRIRWAEKRETKKKEDQAYCLLGIFDVYMPFIYGERDNALRRLQKEINEKYGADVAGALNPNHSTRSFGLCLKSAPLIKSNDFTGRTKEIIAIHNMLQPEQAAAEQQRVVIGGMGGMGKTQLAIAYARYYQHSYTSVFWLNATSELTLHASYRSIASTVIGARELTGLSDEMVLARVHEWLSDLTNQRWLLLFDNHDDPDQFDVDHFCPNVGHGSIIITTRLPDLIIGQPLRLQPLDDVEDGLAILQARSGRQEVHKDVGAGRLAQRLSGFPLALVTAGAFLRTSMFTFQQYLDLYEQNWHVDTRQLLRLPDYRDRTLYTTWNVSLHRLEKEDPGAAQVLRLLAYFDNQDIWYGLCHAGLSEGLPVWLQSALADQKSFDGTMRTLVEYSFVEAQYTSQSYSMHGCVHDWLLVGLSRNVDAQLYWFAFDCVVAGLDRDEWSSLRDSHSNRVGRHGTRLTHLRFQLCDDFGPLRRDRAAIQMAEMLNHQGQFAASERMFTKVLTWCEKVRGTNNIWTLNLISELGSVYSDQGRDEEAEQAYKRVLTSCDEVETSNDVSRATLVVLTRLAELYFSQRKLEETEQTIMRALAFSEERLGLENVTILHTLHLLGRLNQRQKKPEEAKKAFLQVLERSERGQTNDPGIRQSALVSLGQVYEGQSKLQEAEQTYLAALAGNEKGLGVDHESAIHIIKQLGYVYDCQSKFERAAEMYARALPGYQKKLGQEHPDTVLLTKRLARVRDLPNTIGTVSSDSTTISHLPPITTGTWMYIISRLPLIFYKLVQVVQFTLCSLSRLGKILPSIQYGYTRLELYPLSSQAERDSESQDSRVHLTEQDE